MPPVLRRARRAVPVGQSEGTLMPKSGKEMSQVVIDAAREAFEILRDLGTPNEAANALALMHVRLMDASGAIKSEKDARGACAEMTEATLDNWLAQNPGAMRQ